jgi:predicted nucleic acid-binding protein
VIVYFDTSALVALYVEDRCTKQAQAAWRTATHVATSFLAYAEAIAAFAQLRRERGLSVARHERALGEFLADWQTLHRVRLDARILPEVRRVLASHVLKGADAVHLASASLVLRGASLAGSDGRFACDDRALSAAARAEGIALSW